MKSPLQQALKGRSLRSDIFSTFHNRSLNSFSPFLKNSRQRDSRYLPYSSQHTVVRSQMESPNIRTDLSSQKYSPSPPGRFRREEIKNSSPEGGKQWKNQRIKGKKETSSKSKKKSKGKKQTHGRSESKVDVNKSKGEMISVQKKRQEVSGSKQKKKVDKRPKSKDSMKSSSHSKGKSSGHKSKQGDSRLNLSSIIEHQSQERVKTPSSKDGTKLNKSKKVYHAGKTHKKSKCEQLSEIVFKRIQKTCREPGKFLRLIKSDLLSIRHRVERRKIIELQMVVYKDVAGMSVILEKGNLECQHVEERYIKLPANSKFTLFSSVRDVNLEEPFKLPRIHIEITMDDGSIIERHATVPYTWLQFATDAQPRLQRSKIVTKSFLDNLTISTSHLRTLSLILPNWTSRYSHHQSRYTSQFLLGDSLFQLLLREHRGEWSLELCGRGEQRLHRLTIFLSEFLS